jgi:hypothetical protein
VGPYQLQAAIGACHARAPSAADTDWREIAGHKNPPHATEANRKLDDEAGKAFGVVESCSAACRWSNRLARS